MMPIDGSIEDKAGSIDWGEPDGEVLTFINAIKARHDTYLYGRSM
jgi:hypothetical protein